MFNVLNLKTWRLQSYKAQVCLYNRHNVYIPGSDFLSFLDPDRDPCKFLRYTFIIESPLVILHILVVKIIDMLTSI